MPLGPRPMYSCSKKGDSWADGGFDFPWRAHRPIYPAIAAIGQHSLQCISHTVVLATDRKRGRRSRFAGQAVPAFETGVSRVARKLTRVACPPRACGYFDQEPHPVCLAAESGARASLPPCSCHFQTRASRRPTGQAGISEDSLREILQQR